MKIAYVAAGAAGMYCGSCIHDNTLASALMAKGHDVALIPTYTPLRTDETDVSLERIFFGGINIYLLQKSSIFGHVPGFIHRWFDSPRLLKWVSRFSASTSGQELGALASAMLHGEEGNLKGELEDLVAWLRDEFRPDVVELTNSMFLGLARRLREELGVPVLCNVQGEDIFLDQLVEPYRSDVIAELRKRAHDVDGFVSTCKYYSDHMSEFLEVPRDRFHVVPLGIKLDGHDGTADRVKTAGDPFTIGYLARICPEKGLDVLVEAFRLLAEKRGPSRIRLTAAGWLGDTDRPFLEKIEERIESCGLADSWSYLGEVDREQKISFLREVDVLSVPTAYREAKGLFVLEALANGVPLVLPRHGSFPELIESTGGGLLVEPGSPQAVADGIEALIDDSEMRRQLGARGQSVVRKEYSDAAMAENTLRIYDQVLTQRRGEA